MNKVIWSWEDNWSGDQWDRSATKKDYRETESDHKAKTNAIKKEAKKQSQMQNNSHRYINCPTKRHKTLLNTCKYKNIAKNSDLF